MRSRLRRGGGRKRLVFVPAVALGVCTSASFSHRESRSREPCRIRTPAAVQRRAVAPRTAMVSGRCRPTGVGGRGPTGDVQRGWICRRLLLIGRQLAAGGRAGCLVPDRLRRLTVQPGQCVFSRSVTAALARLSSGRRLRECRSRSLVGLWSRAPGASVGCSYRGDQGVHAPRPPDESDAGDTGGLGFGLQRQAVFLVGRCARGRSPRK